MGGDASIEGRSGAKRRPEGSLEVVREHVCSAARGIAAEGVGSSAKRCSEYAPARRGAKRRDGRSVVPMRSLDYAWIAMTTYFSACMNCTNILLGAMV